jgi:hypothetical protein
MGFYTAQVDPRVIALFQIDAFTYPTPRFFGKRYGPKVMNLTSWRNLISGRSELGRKLHGTEAPKASEAVVENMVPTPYWREFPPKEQVAEGLRRLAARGVHMLNLFSGDHSDYYRYQGQHAESFSDVDFRGLMRELHLPDTDHILTGAAEQARAVHAFVAWVREVSGVALVPSPESAATAVD